MSVDHGTTQRTERKVALITGVTGQDGSYLSELLLEKGYEVHGVIRRSSSFNTGRIEHLYGTPHFKLHYGDLTDSSNLVLLISTIRPTEIYNLGAQSHVKVSFEMPEYTAEVDGVGTLRMLDAIKAVGMEKELRFYQASTSELYGKVLEVPQSETTPFYPRSPYGVAKQYGFWITKNYREAYDMYACNGILFNHESPRRGPTFVTRKITRAVAHIYKGKQNVLKLGNLDAERDWGHAKDYVEAMWAIMQLDEADDYVVATGEKHSVREFVEKSFGVIGWAIEWSGEGVNEIGVVKSVRDSTDSSRIGTTVVEVDPAYFRPAEVELLVGNPAKVKKAVNWEPKYSFEELVDEMVKSDIDNVIHGRLTV